jgi:hypothetical protein
MSSNISGVGDGVSHVKSNPLPRIGTLPGVFGRRRTSRPRPGGVEVAKKVRARNKSSCLEHEKSRDSFIIPTNLRTANYPELQSLLNDQRIGYTVPPINEPDLHRLLLNPSTTIRSENTAPSGANYFTPGVHFSSKKIIMLQAIQLFLHHSGRTENQPNNE